MLIKTIKVIEGMALSVVTGRSLKPELKRAARTISSGERELGLNETK